MNWKNAYNALVNDYEPIKLPEWKGYWKRQKGTKSIFIHLENGKIINMKETDSMPFTLEFTLREDWEIATEDNCPVLFSESMGNEIGDFGLAKRLLSMGHRVTCPLFPKGTYLVVGDVTINKQPMKSILITNEHGAGIWSPSQDFIMNEEWRAHV